MGEGRFVNNGGDGGDVEGMKGLVTWLFGEDNGKKDVAVGAVDRGGGIGNKLDNASETFGFG